MMKWLVVTTVALVALLIYVEISDPCVRYEPRGWVAITYGNRTTVEPQQVCVERQSGWKISK